MHLKAIQNNIASKINVIKDLDEEILDAIDDENLIDAEIEDSSVFPDFYFENISKIENFIIFIEKSEEKISITSSIKTENKLKLPKIELKKFGGTVLIWQGFWDQFNSSVNENTELSDINKFSYLK